MPPILCLNRKIGLLGGSFNPAHEGHLDIALQALKACDLDEIWWLISPQNPLKDKQDMGSFNQRSQSVYKLIDGHPKMKVKNIEQEIGTTYTADAIAYIRGRYKNCSFLWIMGADNLAQIHRWNAWQRIFALVPIVILDRPGYTHLAIRGRAAKLFSQFRWPEQTAKLLVQKKAPAWLYLHGRLNPLSASAIRARKLMKSL